MNRASKKSVESGVGGGGGAGTGTDDVNLVYLQ